MVTPAGQRGGGRVLARRYHLQRVLGRGAMGAVWEAEDTFLRRTVAVKEVVIPGSLSPDERAVSVERTMREARAIARLGHPNVVTLFDVLDEDARPWVVMELVPSRSLAEVIKEDGPLHPLRVATIGLAILGALEAAHAAGITHRDVKPGNILLGHDGRVKLTDFGIARAVGDDTITGTGLLVGSPSYIAPEIIKGQEAGAPADLWGLGATLYASVEGRAPFSGGDAMETLSKVVQDPPTPYVRAGALIPALDAMLDKDPLKRAKPVDARRALLDVLRGGNEAEAAPPVARSAPAAAPAPSPSPAPAPAAPVAGPALSDLLVPIWRQDEAADGAASAPRRSGGSGRGASRTGSPAPSDEPGARAGAGPAGAASATRAPAAGSSGSGTPAAGSSAAATSGVGSGGASPAPDAPAAGAEAALPTGSVAGSPVAEQSREVLAEDDDLVDPDVVDPDLVEADVDGGTRTELGLPPQPAAATPAEAAAASATPTGLHPAGPEATGPDPTGLYPAGPEATGPDPAGLHPAGPDPAGPEATGPHPTGPDATGLTSAGPDPSDLDPAGSDRPAAATRAGLGLGAAPAELDPATAPGELDLVAAPAGLDRVSAMPATPDRVTADPAERDPAADEPEPVPAEAEDPPTDPFPGISVDEDGRVDVEPAETGSEATMTIPTGDPPGRPVSFGPADQFGPTVALTPFGRTGEPARTGGASRVGAPSRAGDPGRAGAGSNHDDETTWLGAARPGEGARAGERARAGADPRAGGARPAYGAYGSATDSEKPTQMIAPLPFGGAQGTMSEQQPARAFRAQPPAATPAFPQDRPRGDRRKRTLAALLIVIGLIAAVALGGALLLRSLRGDDSGNQGSGTPTGAASSLGPAKIPTGYTEFTGSGFSVAVPSDWPTTKLRAGVVDAKEPTSTRFLRLITVDSTAGAFEQLSAAERQFDANPSYGAYKRVRLQRVDYRGLDAADWEFTFTLGGTPRHVLYRGIVSGGRTYGLYLSASESQWAASKNVFQVAADTFRTS